MCERLAFGSVSLSPPIDLVSGSLDDIPSILSAFQGVYGAWINVDGFTVGEARETYLGIRIFELAKQAQTVKHYVWSGLDYVSKVGPKLRAMTQYSTPTSIPDYQLRS